MRPRTSFNWLDPLQLAEEISLRERFLEEMVGNLYPDIVKDEIVELRGFWSRVDPQIREIVHSRRFRIRDDYSRESQSKKQDDQIKFLIERLQERENQIKELRSVVMRG